MWRETTKYERNLRIFEEEFQEFLPARILDFHVHIFDRASVPEGEHFNNAGELLSSYEFPDLIQDLEEVYPGRETSAVCFGLPNVRFDAASNNDYIAAHCDNTRFYGLRLFDPCSDTPEALRADLESGRFLGLKPYPCYPRFPNENDVEIKDMLPDWALEVVHEFGLLVMLHIPRSARLADPLNQQQLLRICTRFPEAKIVLAHIGRAYFLKNVVGNLDTLSTLPNLYYDLTMLNHWEVIEYAFSKVRPDLILYGTDIPIALAAGKSVEINHQYTYVTPKPWPLSISDEHGKLRFTSFLYEELRAIKQAVQRLKLGDDFVQGVFYDNGMRLLNEVLSGSRPLPLVSAR